MTVKEKIIELSDKLLDYLLKYRESHEDFKFWMRSREHNRSGDGERLNSGQWFQGSDYIFLSFYRASGHVSMTRSIGWVIELDDDLEPYYYISIVWPTESDSRKITLYEDIVRQLGGFREENDTKYRKDLPATDIFESLSEFLDVVKPSIDALITKHGLASEFQIPEEKFRKQLDRVMEYRQKLQNKIGKGRGVLEVGGGNDMKPFPLNLILYGPPGTGKTHKLLSLQKRFTHSKIVQTREEFLDKLIKELTWWETVTASLLELNKATVPELEKHEYVQIKTKQSGTRHVKQLLWGSLQAHTDPKYQNVQTANRVAPFIFEKLEDSVWTVHAEEVTQNVPEVTNFLESVKDFKPEQKTDLKNYRLVTFHQSFSYEDFVEGIKPVLGELASDNLQYDIQQGVFYKCCVEASKLAGYASLADCIADTREKRAFKIASAPPYALFIDEINRANVSSVLGELITLLEDDKRLGAQNEIINMTLPYSKSLFGVPANLYIIGTMNTADRSVEALDTALRRRFSFQEILPNHTLLAYTYLLRSLWHKHWLAERSNEEWAAWEEEEQGFIQLTDMIIDHDRYVGLSRKFEKEGVEEKWLASDPNTLFNGVVSFGGNGVDFSKMLAAINSRLRVLLTNDHTIGHAWLMNVFCLKDLQAVFKNKILPLLQEYFYNDYAKIGLILGNSFIIQSKAGRSLFATFNDENNLASEYEDKIIYTIKDCDELTIADFRSIYH